MPGVNLKNWLGKAAKDLEANGQVSNAAVGKSWADKLDLPPQDDSAKVAGWF